MIGRAFIGRHEPDELSVAVEQRPAAVSVVEIDRCLDKVGALLAEVCEGAADTDSDDLPAGYGVFQEGGISDGQDLLAQFDGIRIRQLDKGQRSRRVDFEQRNIQFVDELHRLSEKGFLGFENHLNGVGLVDRVGVGHDDTAGMNHDPGAVALVGAAHEFSGNDDAAGLWINGSACARGFKDIGIFRFDFNDGALRFHHFGNDGILRPAGCGDE